METSRANVLIHRSDGQTFAMDDKPIGLLELKGVDAPAMEVFTEKNAVGDGDTVTGSRVAAREITIRAKSRGGIKNAILRARAVVFFDPQYTLRRGYQLRRCDPHRAGLPPEGRGHSVGQPVSAA